MPAIVPNIGHNLNFPAVVSDQANFNAAVNVITEIKFETQTNREIKIHTRFAFSSIVDPDDVEVVEPFDGLVYSKFEPHSFNLTYLKGRYDPKVETTIYVDGVEVSTKTTSASLQVNP